MRDTLQQLKASTPCKDCSLIHPWWRMQFDHLRDKVDTISNLTNTGNLQLVLTEISKCELVCANCHADRTYKRALGKLVEGQCRL